MTTGPLTCESMLERMKDELDNLAGLWSTDKRLVIGIYQFLLLLKEETFNPVCFLPFLMFVDAVNQKRVELENGKKPTPHPNSALYLAMCFR